MLCRRVCVLVARGVSPSSSRLSSSWPHRRVACRAVYSSATLLSSSSSSSQRRQRRRPPVVSPPGQSRTDGNNNNNNNDDNNNSDNRDDAAAAAEFGVLQNVHIKAFPVRAAIDIGSAGHMSLCVARVDAAHAAIQRVLYQTQLPLHLESTVPLSTAATAATTMRESSRDDSDTATVSSSSSLFVDAAAAAAGDVHRAVAAGAFTLSERSVLDLRNKMQVLRGVLRRDSLRGVSECAAVLSWPLCVAQNAHEVAAALTREFAMPVRVLGGDFTVQLPWRDATTAASATTESNDNNNDNDDDDDMATLASARDGARHDAQHGLKALLARTAAARKRRRRQQQQQQQHTSARDVAARSRALQASVLHLAFLAHAAMTECVAPQRMLVVHDSPQHGLVLVGAATTAADDVADLLERAGDDADERARILRACGDDEDSSSSNNHRDNDAGAAMALCEHRLPVDVAAALRLCIVDVQRRHVPPPLVQSHSDAHDAAAAAAVLQRSPNPMLASEYAQLCELLTRMLTPTLPPWLRRKAALGGVVCGTSYNGGILNIAARVAQRAPIARTHLDVHAAHHFAALTDVLLAETFPCARAVLPAAALTSALMAALQTPRIAYVPELTTAAALLLQPSLWLHAQRDAVRRRLRDDAFYHSSRQRSFVRPHTRAQPTAAPHAHAPRGTAPPPSWDTTAYANSLAGTS